MIESGLVLLIQPGLTGLFPTCPGGFGVQLPDDLISPTVPWAWTYRRITREPSYLLNGQDSFMSAEYQIDCHGYSMANAITLAHAIEAVLSGSYAGTLTDADSTVVYGIFMLPGAPDGYSDANRSYVRSLEIQIDYDQT